MYHFSSGAGFAFPELQRMETLSPSSYSDLSPMRTGPSDGGTKTRFNIKNRMKISYLFFIEILRMKQFEVLIKENTETSTKI